MAKFQKKPVIVDVFLIEFGVLSHTSIKRWVESFGDVFENHFMWIDADNLRVKTLEGTSYAVTGEDVIIRGVKGEYYPCKKDVFYQTYDRVIDNYVNHSYLY